MPFISLRTPGVSMSDSIQRSRWAAEPAPKSPLKDRFEVHSSRSCWGLQARSANHLPPRLVECMPLDLLVNRAGDTRRRQRTRFLIIEPWLEIASSTPAHWLWLGHWMAALPKVQPSAFKCSVGRCYNSIRRQLSNGRAVPFGRRESFFLADHEIYRRMLWNNESRDRRHQSVGRESS